MKKLVLLLIIALTVATACHKKAVPVITDRTKEPTAPVLPPLNIKPDTAMGRTVFTVRCARCHDLPEPAKYTLQRWDGILSTMIPRARLTREQGFHVTAYVKANASK